MLVGVSAADDGDDFAGVLEEPGEGEVGAGGVVLGGDFVDRGLFEVFREGDRRGSSGRILPPGGRVKLPARGLQESGVMFFSRHWIEGARR